MLENTETVLLNLKEVYSEDGISKIFLLKYTYDPPDPNSSSGGKHSNFKGTHYVLERRKINITMILTVFPFIEQ